MGRLYIMLTKHNSIMKKCLFISFCVCLGEFLFAQNTFVSGFQSPGEHVWSDSVNIVGDVYFPPQSTLNILPGTTIIISDTFIIESKGVVLAKGINSNPILFTVADTLGFHSPYTHSGGWKGFHLNSSSITPTDSSVFDYCHFYFAKNLNSGGALSIKNYKSIRVSHSLFTFNSAYSGGGFYADSIQNAQVLNCTFSNNQSFGGGAALHWGAQIWGKISNSLFFKNKAEFLSPQGNDMFFSSTSAVYIDLNHDTASVLRFVNNRVFANSVKAGVLIRRVQLVMNNCIIANNKHIGALIESGNILIPDLFNIYRQAISNCIFYKNGSFGLNIENQFLKVSNSIFAKNTHEGYGGQIVVNSPNYLSRTSFTYNMVQYGINTPLYYQDTTYYDIPVFFDDNLEIGLDTNVVHADFHLVNMGIDWGAKDTSGLFLEPYDLSGNKRVVKQVDVGVYEDQLGLGVQDYSASSTLYVNEYGQICGLEENESFLLANSQGAILGQLNLANLPSGIYIVLRSSHHKNQKILWIKK